MLSCRQVTDVVARGELDGVSWRTRLAIHMHLMMCRHCRSYVNQLRRIGEAMRSLFDREAVEPGRLADLEAAVLAKAGIPAASPGSGGDDSRGRH